MSDYLPDGATDEQYSTAPDYLDQQDDDDGLDPSEDEEDYSDCGWTPGGGCSMAGSEECDFECPNRDSMIAELNRKAKS